MENLDVDEHLRSNIVEIYDETRCRVTLKGEYVEQFNTDKGVRLGVSPLSPSLFDVLFAHL